MIIPKSFSNQHRDSAYHLQFPSNISRDNMVIIGQDNEVVISFEESVDDQFCAVCFSENSSYNITCVDRN